MAHYLTSVVLALIMLIYSLFHETSAHSAILWQLSATDTNRASAAFLSLSLSSVMSTDVGRVHVDWDTQTGWLTWCMVQ